MHKSLVIFANCFFKHTQDSLEKNENFIFTFWKLKVLIFHFEMMFEISNGKIFKEITNNNTSFNQKLFFKLLVCQGLQNIFLTARKPPQII